MQSPVFTSPAAGAAPSEEEYEVERILSEDSAGKFLVRTRRSAHLWSQK